MIVIQPHYDDAVYSMGATMAAEKRRVTGVLTVFAGVPEVPVQTHYDVQCGFGDSTEAMEEREQENKRACAVLGLKSLGVRKGDDDLFDQQYGGWRPDSAHVAHAIRDYLGPPGSLIAAPLGIVHQDHTLTADAALLIAQTGNIGHDLWLYEDLPYRVLYPEFAAERIDGMRAEGWRMELLPQRYDDEEQAWKRAAVACFRSQLDRPDDPTLLVPERIWHARPERVRPS